MAQNYTLGEAAKVLSEGTNVEQISDLSRRFPMFTNKFMKAYATGGDALVEFMACIPEYINPRKVEKVITAGQSASDDAGSDETEAVEQDTAQEAEEEKPAPKKRGRRKAAKPEPEVEAEAETDEEQQDGKYAGKNAMELFKECKKRGIKAQPKKPVKYYVELLEEDDEVLASESDNDANDDDDWDI